jgi:predicted RNase H-like HicB family nuclease
MMTELNELLKRYKVLLYWSDVDQAYLAEMPELPGCMADGATPETAIANLYEVAALWIETALELGRPVPLMITNTENLKHTLSQLEPRRNPVASSARKREKEDQDQRGRSIRRDVKQPAKRTVPPGQGDKGDQKRRK